MRRAKILERLVEEMQWINATLNGIEYRLSVQNELLQEQNLLLAEAAMAEAEDPNNDVLDLANPITTVAPWTQEARSNGTT